jgi:hypothetical protein
MKHTSKRVLEKNVLPGQDMHPTQHDLIYKRVLPRRYKRPSPTSIHTFEHFSPFSLLAFNPGKPFKYMDKEMDLDRNAIGKIYN